MEPNQDLLGIFKVDAILIVLILHYVYFYFLHKVYGVKLYDVRNVNRKLSFKTNKSVFQISKEHQKFMYKTKKERHWKSIAFKDIKGIHVEKQVGTASIVEFFFGGFGLFDFFRKYRDRLHTYDIKLSVVSGHQDINMDVIILSLKQYEQREFFLGQLMHDFDLWLMKKLGFYIPIRDIYQDKMNDVVKLIQPYGLELKCLD